MERQHLLQLKKSLETEAGIIQEQLKVSRTADTSQTLSIIIRNDLTVCSAGRKT